MTFLANGYSVKYVPIEYAPRPGRSKFHWWSDTRRYLTQVMRMVLSYNPLRVFLPARCRAHRLLGIVKLVLRLVDEGLPRRRRTRCSILFAAFQVFAIGLLADLVVRVTKPDTEVEPATK